MITLQKAPEVDQKKLRAMLAVAMRAAAEKGHRMEKPEFIYRRRAFAVCKDCDKSVEIDLRCCGPKGEQQLKDCSTTATCLCWPKPLPGFTVPQSIHRGNAEGYCSCGIHIYDVDTGHYNSMPLGWRELTMEEFAQSRFFVYSVIATEFRQFEFKDLRGEKVMQSVRMFHTDVAEGFALVNDYWKGAVRFFRFGCEHEYRKMTNKEVHKFGVHDLICKHCGVTYDRPDSSG